MEKELTKTLVLHIEVPDFYVEDVEQAAAEWVEDGDSIEDAIHDIVVEEFMESEVGLTFIALPGEKNLNSDATLHARTCQIVGAEIRNRS